MIEKCPMHRAGTRQAATRLLPQWLAAAAVLVGCASAQPRVEPPDPEAVVTRPAIERVGTFVTRNSMLRRWEQDAERPDVIQELKRVRQIPDVTVGAGVRRAQAVAETALVDGVPIPLFYHNQGDRAAVHQDLVRARRRFFQPRSGEASAPRSYRLAEAEIERIAGTSLGSDVAATRGDNP